MKVLQWAGLAIAVAVIVMGLGNHRPADAQQPVPVAQPVGAPVQFAQPVSPIVVATSSSPQVFFRVGDTYLNSARIDYFAVRGDKLEVYLTGRNEPVELL